MNLNFRTYLSLLLTLCGIAVTCRAAHPSMIRFHCDNDTVKIQSLLSRGAELSDKNPGKLVLFYAEALMNTPYVAHTLEGEDEYLTIDIDGLDCTTYMETCLSLARCTINERVSWRNFANNLEKIRYRNGEMNGYPSRLHYISDWILDNTSRGNVREITNNFPNVKYIVKTLDFMSSNAEKYSALKNNESNLEGIKNMEMGYRSHRYPIVVKGSLKDKTTKSMLKDGDMIALMTKTPGLDASHVGIIKIIDGTPWLIHASMKEMKVTLSAIDLAEYLRMVKTCDGIRIFRMIE